MSDFYSTPLTRTLVRQTKITGCVSCYVTDLLYRQTVTVNNSPLEVEIVDVSGETVSSLHSQTIEIKCAVTQLRRLDAGFSV
jgi:hypothetical protein